MSVKRLKLIVFAFLKKRSITLRNLAEINIDSTVIQ